MRYIVTNVRLEPHLFRALKLRALERGVPASAIIRKALEEHLATRELSKAEWERAKAEILKFCGVGRGKERGKGTGSTDIDEVLYGPYLYRKPRK